MAIGLFPRITEFSGSVHSLGRRDEDTQSFTSPLLSLTARSGAAGCGYPIHSVVRLTER